MSNEKNENQKTMTSSLAEHGMNISQTVGNMVSAYNLLYSEAIGRDETIKKMTEDAKAKDLKIEELTQKLKEFEGE